MRRSAKDRVRDLFALLCCGLALFGLLFLVALLDSNGFFDMLTASPYVRTIRDLASLLCIVVGVWLALLLLRKAAQATPNLIQVIFSARTAALIRAWHGGQIVLFWTGLVFAWVMLTAVVESEAIPRSGTHYETLYCPPNPISICGSGLTYNTLGILTPSAKTIATPDPHPIGDFVHWFVVFALIIGIPTGLLTVTWIWFGGRRSAPERTRL